MSRIYNSEALSDFVERIELAKSRRIEFVEQIIRSFSEALLQIEGIEIQINDRIRQLQDPTVRRPRAKRRLIVSWENVGPRGDVLSAPRGPSWFITDKQGTVLHRVHQPTADVLRRIYREEYYATSKNLRDEIKRLNANREHLLKYLSMAYRASRSVSNTPEAGDQKVSLFSRPIPRSMPEHVTAALLGRRSVVGCLVGNFRRALAYAQQKEEEIEVNMIEFNQHGKKNRNIMVRWDMPKNIDTTVAGVLGPYWFKVFKNRHARYKKRLLNETAINRDLIRDSWQGRNSKVLLGTAQKIHDLSRERSEIIALFTAVKRDYIRLIKKELI